jgi:DNA-binding transcriptional regulator YhcF (GntR family)
VIRSEKCAISSYLVALLIIANKMNIQLQSSAKGPIYLQLREQIESQIRSKAIAAGEPLPSPAALAQKLSIDKGEVQRAYYELEQSGLIKRESGKDFLGKAKLAYRVV